MLEQDPNAVAAAQQQQPPAADAPPADPNAPATAAPAAPAAPTAAATTDAAPAKKAIDEEPPSIPAVIITILSIIGVIIAYYAVISLGIVAMELLFPKVWYRFVTTLVLCLATLFIAYVGSHLYFVQRSKRVVDLDGQWFYSKPFIIVNFVLTVLSFLLFIASIIVYLAITFWKLDYGVAHFIITAVSCLLLSILFGGNMLRSRVEALKVLEGPYQWWFMIFVYPFCWAVIIASHVILWVYSDTFILARTNAWGIAIALSFIQFFVFNGFAYVLAMLVELPLIRHCMKLCI